MTEQEHHESFVVTGDLTQILCYQTDEMTQQIPA